jgi:YHS domain-containing protein
VQGPEQYLNELGLQLQCVVDPSRPAILDMAHRALVNYEAYYFCDDAAMKKFAEAPYKYTGKVTDPVTMDRFTPNADSPSRSYMGRLLYFTSNETASTFDGNPMKYGMPMPGMREKKQAG